MILIYVSKITPRVEYIFDLFFNDLLKVKYSLSQDREAFRSHTGPKFCYLQQPLEGVLSFTSSNILFENKIFAQPVQNIKPGMEEELFKVDSGSLGFDMFGAAFYLVSRYEEYLPHFKDRHGRYKVEDSLAYKADFLGKPLINFWALKLKDILTQHFPQIDFPKASFTFTPTIDIDNAYAFKYKGAIRSFLCCLLLLFQLQLGKFWNRLLVHFGLKEDPYDTYKKQTEIHTKYRVSPIYFVLLGNYSQHDKNLSHRHPKYISLIKTFEANGDVGMHPSYRAATSIGQMKLEKERLETILGRTVTKSRAHYIRIALPDTYRILQEIGITDDYSMGYASQPGFRASIASPFYFYDLDKEQVTQLRIHPFVVMDTTLKKYLHIRAKDLMDYLYPLIEETKLAHGNFTFIFHNESMGGSKVWKNWGSVYEDFMKILSARTF